MPSDEEFEELKGRIVELENQLRRRTTKRVTDITPEELETFQKVRDVIAADFGDFCGINDCFRCIVNCIQLCIVRCSQPCIFECTCGPCSPGTFGTAGVSRFGGLGA